jgi:acetyltransferase-like isoleucine patch superfamily enzyme
MLARAWRIAWTLLTFIVVEGIVAGVAALPVTWLWLWLLVRTSHLPWLRITSVSLALFPSYVLFALLFMFLSALAARGMRWRTEPAAAMRIRDIDWNLLHWLRYVALSHLVRLVAGTLFRATPLWTFYLRLNGVRAGRRVYVNSLSVMDHNLLELGEGTVVGADVHLSGHTVEDGIVYTAPVRIGRNVTLGTGSVIGIGVVIGDGAQIGALSLVPKHTTLPGGAVYIGIPVHPFATDASGTSANDSAQAAREAAS